jgi:DNA-binding transcriptional LysR family regulator
MREIVLPWWNTKTAEYPELSLEVHISALSKVSFELVQAGMDAGFLEHKEDLADFICKPVYSETWGIVTHVDSNLDVDHSSALKKLNWCTLSSQTNPVEEWLVRRQKMPPPIYKLYWNDLTALTRYVADTPNMATVLPKHSCQRLLSQGRLNFKPIGRDAKRTLYLAYRQNHPHKKFIQELLRLGHDPDHS